MKSLFRESFVIFLVNGNMIYQKLFQFILFSKERYRKADDLLNVMANNICISQSFYLYTICFDDRKYIDPEGIFPEQCNKDNCVYPHVHLSTLCPLQSSICPLLLPCIVCVSTAFNVQLFHQCGVCVFSL